MYLLIENIVFLDKQCLLSEKVFFYRKTVYRGKQCLSVKNSVYLHYWAFECHRHIVNQQ